MQKIISALIFLFIAKLSLAQYTVNGNALQLSCNEYRLTDSANTQSGSVWNNNKIDLTQSFDFKFDIFLGYKDAGADGIVFVLQPISTSVGTSGGGLGYEGVAPAVGVTIDTWQNGNNNDPAYDHIAIQLNGDINHATVNNIAGPVQAVSGNDNIEDGQWHALRINWNAALNTLTVYIDGVVRVTTIKDFVTDVFSGNPSVFWGFTGSTGGANNLQKFKTALNPAFTFSAGQKRCINEPVAFKDSTISFSNIAKFYWDFGDGSPVDSVNLNPVHIYTTGGDYIVKQRVIGADGCEATNTQVVRIGTKPLVNDIQTNTVNCCDNVWFKGIASVQFGTIDSLGWSWDFNNGLTSNTANPTTSYVISGAKHISCSVKTFEGCESDRVHKVVPIYSRTFAEINAPDSICLGQSVTASATFYSVGGDPVIAWKWFVDNQDMGLNNSPVTVNLKPSGNHTFSFFASTDGTLLFCPAIKHKTVFVKEKPTANFGINTTLLCTGLPVSFIDSSTAGTNTISNWSWTYNNTQWSTQQNPSKIFPWGNQTVGLVVTSSIGCKSDTAYKTFYVNPLPNVTMTFKDACKFAPVSFTAVDNSGTVTQWKWEFGDGSIANIQNATHAYNANGTYKVKLFATAAATGCYDGKLEKNIIIYGTNAFAGNDTIAAAGQPVQLHATGGLSYTWSPANLLNDATSATPLATLQSTQTFTLKAFTPEGCESYDDVTVKIYKGPDIYLPNAFTPNGDGLNDIFRGIPVGLQQFDYLKIYNRWGQLIFYTTDYRAGWNGNWQGQHQPGGVYIVLAKGKDYKGNIINKKETVMLIR